MLSAGTPILFLTIAVDEGSIANQGFCAKRICRSQDPGFSRGGGGAPTPKSAIIFQFFCRKLHENERIWTPGGHVPGAPLGSANGSSIFTSGS